MLATIALAAALAAPDVYTDDKGCHWKKPATVVAAKPRHAASAASAASAPKVKAKIARKKRTPKPPTPGDELIGCDEDGPVMRSDIETIDLFPSTAPPETFEKIAPIAAAAASVVPVTFDEGCACSGGGIIVVGGGWFGGGGGGGFMPPPHPPVTAPVPEPGAWTLLLVGLGAVLTLNRRRKRR